jgi:beta-N-acetylhexosaminidase
VGSVLKHFPGYGNNADTHVQIAYDDRSLESLESCDLIPFRAGMDAGADAIMVAHTIVREIDPDTPASLSPAVHQYLRQEMGYDGVITTDDLVMDAITKQYGAGEAAVLAVLAGNDVLCCTEYAVQYEAVLEAVLTGRIDFYDLNDAVMRILRWKQELGLI